MWLDVGYAIEVRDQRRAAAVARSQGRKGVELDEDDDVFDVDPIALVDFLETVDGWDVDRYGADVLSLLTTTRVIRTLTKHEAQVLRRKIEAGEEVAPR